MVPAQMDAYARLMGVQNCIRECSTCCCHGCDRWDGCKCEVECCCCMRDGDCGACSCCVADAKILVACCDIMDAVSASLRAKYAPSVPEDEQPVEEGAPSAAARITSPVEGDEEENKVEESSPPASFIAAFRAFAAEDPAGAMALLDNSN